jgi:hypothetical protein
MCNVSGAQVRVHLRARGAAGEVHARHAGAAGAAGDRAHGLRRAAHALHCLPRLRARQGRHQPGTLRPNLVPLTATDVYIRQRLFP